MLTIPEVRDIINMVLEDPDSYDLVEILTLVEKNLHRRPYVRKASARVFMDPKTRLAILLIARTFPRMSYQEISEKVGTTIGRVSEVLAGKRSAAA